ncbi:MULTISPECIES: DJ-1/PfpI family protein [Bifidobacterium]|uniref:DJ-1/PfpI family protein n=1 Tax=Bifidobacterium TaxID=1678 RepID=UPI002357A33A|nr:DJ-1/PfpI family protein [Bifidobacterium tibiigranuli]MCH3975762.1 DJ-1/PfpI family protein [Bifidobacterium tibiigranuli]MCH4189318.1 DJ-1/PfpI family protein [Bifidobacterium tibiigranuli]MCH4203047.1 DJ-1/PfpI family protein [Bifidobacterium tibiigranuli]MCH4274804.1 DJ-1/PfpI family protein [Bifidobacterium tibiigranuli]MCI1211683.1 DJ-1/PfpI family protein [Bifidobacterium tibiigranuli]
MECLDIAVLLFEGFEPLDAFGPVEMLGYLGKIDGSPVETRLRSVSQQGGLVRGGYGVPVQTAPVSSDDKPDVLLVPGGGGTRPLSKDAGFIAMLDSLASRSTHCLTVCTGSALLAATGQLDGRRATSNKRALNWVKSVRPQVNWQNQARWEGDGKYVTSSGISAGIDMALGWIAGQYGVELARRIAEHTEYRWAEDPYDDPFAVEPSPSPAGQSSDQA